ncbi:hypothetical protein DFH29DRAFT_875724 [Suillus ampliporus]|nr:hypothetical protein DFH29DRAFT_875724 [Suillus ampliporus]
MYQANTAVLQWVMMIAMVVYFWKLEHKCICARTPLEVRKPTKGSNENPCLNLDDTQVGHTTEQTEHWNDDLLPIMQEEELLYLIDFSDLELESGQPQDLIHQQPLHYQHPHQHQQSHLHQHQHLHQQLHQHQQHTEQGRPFVNIHVPLPPTVCGAERLGRHLWDPQAQPIYPAPYALPGLHKIMVFGPRYNQAGSSKDVTLKCPTAKDLPSQPLPPLNTSAISSTVPASPTQSHNHATLDMVLVPHQQQHPVPVPANHVEDIHARARSKMRRTVLMSNGMPSNDKNIQMACDVISQAMQIFPQTNIISPGRHLLLHSPKLPSPFTSANVQRPVNTWSPPEHPGSNLDNLNIW